MIISLIVAASNNNVIGYEGKLPWHLPADLKHFKNVTWGMPLIMGRKTFQSLGKALPGRKNIVITRQPDSLNLGADPGAVIVVKSLEEALSSAIETDAKEVFIIGGGEIFKMTFEMAKRIYFTRINAEFPGDTYFPEMDKRDWRLISNIDHSADEKNVYGYSFQVWEKRNN
ncbi:MAG: dihydrofolate reductase [Bacteroidetes bacterium]|nr:dihydrofolate reductase [Bacteroidota bacterium]MBS1633266.1 dihydrofolate reductase [Bacteroidota bacterium]